MYNVAVIGASGAVGRRMLLDLAESDIAEKLALRVFASERSLGQVLEFKGCKLSLEVWGEKNLGEFDAVLMSAGSAFSRQHAESIASSGAWVIDNSSCWRQDERFPLLVPEVNLSELSKYKRPTILANPNCSTIQMVVALKALQESFGISQVHVSTYQSVSGSGHSGVLALEQEQESNSFSPDSPYSSSIFNSLLPAIGAYQLGENCEEEGKMVAETKKLLDLPNLDIFASVVRVPIKNCHGETVHIKLSKNSDLEQILDCLARQPGLVLNTLAGVEHEPRPENWTGRADVGVGRVRYHTSSSGDTWVQLWCIADNLRKGAATNAVGILLALDKQASLSLS